MGATRYFNRYRRPYYRNRYHERNQSDEDREEPSWWWYAYRKAKGIANHLSKVFLEVMTIKVATDVARKVGTNIAQNLMDTGTKLLPAS